MASCQPTYKYFQSRLVNMQSNAGCILSCVWLWLWLWVRVWLWVNVVVAWLLASCTSYEMKSRKPQKQSNRPICTHVASLQRPYLGACQRQLTLHVCESDTQCRHTKQPSKHKTTQRQSKSKRSVVCTWVSMMLGHEGCMMQASKHSTSPDIAAVQTFRQGPPLTHGDILDEQVRLGASGKGPVGDLQGSSTLQELCEEATSTFWSRCTAGVKMANSDRRCLVQTNHTAHMSWFRTLSLAQ
jgi:hypothetical protein